MNKAGAGGLMGKLSGLSGARVSEPRQKYQPSVGFILRETGLVKIRNQCQFFCTRQPF